MVAESTSQVSRRAVLAQLGLAGLAASLASPAWAFPGAWLADDEEVLPFTDVPADFRPTGRRLDLRQLRSWITPADNFYEVQHYGPPPKLDAAAWRLEGMGLAGRPRTYTLEEIKKRPRIERTLFFECSGNSARTFHGSMGNATWTGTKLGDLLGELRPASDVKDVIFWGVDAGEETLRGNKFRMHFARSMSLEDAMESDAMLAYEINGQPLPAGNGFPVRLIVPGWYGICNVKWLSRIELSDRRFMGRFMGRDYVNIVGREVGGQTEYTEVSVTRMNVKSVVARVTRTPPGGRTKVFGAAWSGEGTPLKAVEVQIDNGPWRPAKLEAQSNPYAWTFFTLDTEPLPPGKHTVVSRATDQRGRQQLPEAELNERKKTNWENNGQFIRTIQVG
jgi:DMSO/TMAO reductase YedYZ molybdopterin-dependent catalytic subunit